MKRPRPANGSIVLLLVDEVPLTRDSMVQSLHTRAPDFIVEAVAHCEAVMASAFDPDIILLNCKTYSLQGREVNAETSVISETWPSVPRLIMSEQITPPAIALEALGLGWQGYLPADQSVDLLIAAIRLVAVGGIFLPAQAFDLCISRHQVKLE